MQFSLRREQCWTCVVPTVEKIIVSLMLWTVIGRSLWIIQKNSRSTGNSHYTSVRIINQFTTSTENVQIFIVPVHLTEFIFFCNIFCVIGLIHLDWLWVLFTNPSISSPNFRIFSHFTSLTAIPLKEMTWNMVQYLHATNILAKQRAVVRRFAGNPRTLRKVSWDFQQISGIFWKTHGSVRTVDLPCFVLCPDCLFRQRKEAPGSTCVSTNNI